MPFPGHFYLILNSWKRDGTYFKYKSVLSNWSPVLRHCPTREKLLFSFFFFLNLLFKGRKDIMRRMGATSIQVEPVQSSTAPNGWDIINLQNTQHKNRKKKISQQPRNFQLSNNTVAAYCCMQCCIISRICIIISLTWTYNHTVLLSL